MMKPLGKKENLLKSITTRWTRCLASLLKRTHEGFSSKGHYGDGASIKLEFKKVKSSKRKGNKVGVSSVSSSPEKVVKIDDQHFTISALVILSLVIRTKAVITDGSDFDT